MLEEGGTVSFNHDVAIKLYPIAKISYFAGIIVRIVLLLISFKWSKICRTYLAFDLITLIIDKFFVLDIRFETDNFILLLSYFSHYVCLSYDVASSLIITLISQVGYLLIQYYLYEKTLAAVMVNLFIKMFQLTFTLLSVQLCYKWAGYMYANSEILRRGNEQLLDGLEEGLIILESDD